MGDDHDDLLTVGWSWPRAPVWVMACWEFVEMGELLPEFGNWREGPQEGGQAGHGYIYVGPVFCGSGGPGRASLST